MWKNINVQIELHKIPSTIDEYKTRGIIQSGNPQNHRNSKKTSKSTKSTIFTKTTQQQFKFENKQIIFLMQKLSCHMANI